MIDLRARLHDLSARGALELPVLPRAAHEVLRLTADDDVDLRTVADVLRSDPTLAGHVLRVANSPLFRGRTPVVSLPQALARLGRTQTRQVMLVVACETKVLAVRERDADAWLAHATRAAVIAQEIAREKRQSTEEAFLCGLLHDVGVPVLWQAVAGLGGSPSRAEIDEVVDELHAAVGAAVVRAWALPARLGDVIAHHHGPVPASDGPFVRAALALADHVADGGAMEDAGELARALDLYPDDLAAVAARARPVEAA